MFEKLKVISPLGWNIIIGTLISRMVFFMSMPFISIYLTQKKGIDPATVGLIIASSFMVGLLFSVWGGTITDYFGTKRILQIIPFVWGVVFIMFAVVDSVPMFFLINSLHGLCQSIFEPATKKALAESSDEGNRKLIYNYRYTAINIGAIAGPYLGYVAGSSSNLSSFIILGFTYFLYGISLILILRKFEFKENFGNNVSIKEIAITLKNDKVFLLVTLGMIMSLAGYSNFNSTIPQYLGASKSIENGVKMYALITTINALTVIAFQYPVLKLMEKRSPITPIILGNILTAFGLLCYGLTYDKIMLCLITVVFSIGELLMFSSTDALTDLLAKPDMKGTYFGAMGFNKLGNVIAPWMGGLLISNFGIERPIYIFLPIALVTISGMIALLAAKNIFEKKDLRFVEIKEV